MRALSFSPSQSFIDLHVETLRLRNHGAFWAELQRGFKERGRFYLYLVAIILGSDASQLDASDEVDEDFPDALREPILRRVQFSQISRIDNLGKRSEA